MTLDEAMLIMRDMLAYYGRKMPDEAQKHWCRGLLPYNAWAARRAMHDLWDGSVTLPSRGAFLGACRARQEEMYPAPPPPSERVEDWEVELGKAVMPHFMRYARGQSTLNEWANDFRAVARAQGVEDKINWSEWETIGASFYV
jgi:hypothetical protein